MQEFKANNNNVETEIEMCDQEIDAFFNITNYNFKIKRRMYLEERACLEKRFENFFFDEKKQMIIKYMKKLSKFIIPFKKLWNRGAIVFLDEPSEREILKSFKEMHVMLRIADRSEVIAPVTSSGNSDPIELVIIASRFHKESGAVYSTVLVFEGIVERDIMVHGLSCREFVSCTCKKSKDLIDHLIKNYSDFLIPLGFNKKRMGKHELFKHLLFQKKIKK